MCCGVLCLVLIQVDRLELVDAGGATSSTLDVSWRPPTKNKDRITGYKLMLSSSTGEEMQGVDCTGYSIPY